MTQSRAAALYETHKATLDRAIQAVRERSYWSAYPESMSGKIYGESAKADGEAAFKAMLGQPFELPGVTAGTRVGKEDSPWGLALAISYPASDATSLVSRAKAAGAAWASASIDERAGIALEILHRINRHSFLMANAVMHTTGQSFPMAFQAGGPHAQDRGLEAVAYAVEEMRRVPATARWEKPQGGGQAPITMDKAWRIIPRGVGLVIGCATFPTWNGYPGLFASLATGNTVIVKPHPMAILPLAITVRIAREVLGEAGLPADVVQLAPDELGAPITKELALHPDVAIIDFTGSSAFGSWVRQIAAGKQVFTEEAGVNTIVVASTPSFKGMCSNIAFSLSLYSGQMCTAPQAIFVPAGGIDSDEGRKSFEEVAKGIAGAVEKLVGSNERAAGLCGAIQSTVTAQRVAEMAGRPGVLLASRAYEAPGLPGARTATPVIIACDAGEEALYGEERFGPISFVVKVADSAEGIRRAAGLARSKGAITASVYSTDPAVTATAEEAFADAGAALSLNLTGGIFVNQSAAFSDYHVSGANPAGNACLTDAAYVASRFRVASVRRHAPAA